jgi:hypothetical protein
VPTYEGGGGNPRHPDPLWSGSATEATPILAPRDRLDDDEASSSESEFAADLEWRRSSTAFPFGNDVSTDAGGAGKSRSTLAVDGGARALFRVVTTERRHDRST